MTKILAALFALAALALAQFSGGSGGGGGGSSTPCTTTALSVQYNNAGAFGCIPDFTFSTPHTLVAGASGIFDMSLMTGSNMKLPGSLNTGLVTVTTSTGAISSVAAPAGTIVGTSDTQTLTNKTVDGVTPTVFGYIDATSSIQTQLNGKQATLTIGNFTEATSTILTILGGTGAIIGSGLSVQVKQASGSQSGYLSSTDWNTFNGKQGALTLPLTRANGGLNSASAGTGLLRDGTTPAASELSGDATTSGSNAVSVVKVNGGSVPASAALLGTNSSSQPTASTGHSVASVLTCATSSNSGTAETCSTSPTFTPVAGDSVIFQADIPNIGAFTLNVNSLGVKSVKKNGTAALIANDILASPFQVLLAYDGTNWEMQGQGGNASSGGGASISSGSYSGLPATCTAGDLYFQTDGPYVFACTATNTWTPFVAGFGAATLPPSTGWTSDNISTGSISWTQGFGLLSGPGNSNTAAFRAEYRTAPSAPYTVTMLIGLDSGSANTSNEFGLEWGFEDNTGKAVNGLLSTGNSAPGTGFYITCKFTSSSSFSACYSDGTGNVSSLLPLIDARYIWLQAKDDNTNLSWYYSLDGTNFTQLGANHSRTDFMAAPTRILWGIDPLGGTGTVRARLLSWTAQ